MKLEDIKNLCDAATPGPWLASSAYPSDGIWYANTPETKTKRESELNAEFVAAARTLLPKFVELAMALDEIPVGKPFEGNGSLDVVFLRLVNARKALQADP